MNERNKRIMIRYSTLFVTIILLSASSMIALASNEAELNITKQYLFDEPSVVKTMVGGSVYDHIILPNSDIVGNPGDFNVPSYTATLLLSQGTKITDIDVTSGDMIHIGSGFILDVIKQPIKLSESDTVFQPTFETFTDSTDDLYQQSLFTVIGTYGFRGYTFLILNLHPITYIEATGDLFYYNEVTVSVYLEATEFPNPLFRDIRLDEIEIAKKVDNPELIDTYSKQPTAPLSVDTYDLLILTTEELKYTFDPLKNAHDADGIITEIKTLEDISILPGSVTPEDIRDFITDEYRENGIEYVLIGGDDDVVPAKQLWVQAWNGGDTTFMPSDMYYACLDGTYNFDNDEKWGEPDDGPEGGDVDLVAEVYIGRACVGNIDETDNFVGKTLAYLDSGGYSSGQALMVGEYLWPNTWGGDYMDELIDGSSTHGYTTVGIPSGVYTIDTLYDRDWSGNDWPKSELKNRINNGALLVNHLGHASYDYNMKMGKNDVNSLINVQPNFVYSQGCMAGGFDDDDCIAEHFTVKTENAAFAGIWNARYGWGVQGGTDGASQRFHREFLDAMFGEDIPQLGKANQDSKEDNIHRINYPCMRWCYYQLNLFGDPVLAFNENDNTVPNTPTQPSGTSTGKVKTDYVFTTTSSDDDGDELYYKWDFGDGTFSDWVGPFESDEEVQILHNWSKRGFHQITVKVRDEHRGESDWSDPSTLLIWRGFPLLELLLELIESLFS